GRNRARGERWGPRSLDLDLLWDERGAHASPGLRVPHPELENRGFALAPLLDVAPELATALAPSLARLGGRPSVWTRQAVIQARSFDRGFEVEVEADSLLDACVLCIGQMPSAGRPWSTRHVAIEPRPERFALILRDLLHDGFSAQCATISQCSKTRWLVELHGVNTGIRLAAHVGLQTTLATRRAFGAKLSLELPEV
ncbi:MAG: 2-amino-4-hydroxy-6-hydroxymethyldihydropteridine diphosphokinase, partial [Burkholderiales bacterium]